MPRWFHNCKKKKLFISEGYTGDEEQAQAKYPPPTAMWKLTDVLQSIFHILLCKH